MKVSKYFYLQEFVPKELYHDFGEKSLWFIDKRLFSICDLVRDLSNSPVLINTWMNDGSRNESGYRLPYTTTGGKLSQHKRGAAVDIVVNYMPPEKVKDLIIEHKTQFIQLGLSCMENVSFTPTWNHLDTRNTGIEDIIFVNP